MQSNRQMFKTSFTILLFTIISLFAQAQEQTHRYNDFITYVSPDRDTLYMTNCEMSTLTLTIWTDPQYVNEQPVFVLCGKDIILNMLEKQEGKLEVMQ